MKKGFTIVELSLSLIFISTLSLIVAVMVTNAISSFNKGITLDQLNTEGMDLVSEFRAAIQGAPARPVGDECKTLYSDSNKTSLDSCESDGALGFVMRRQSGAVTLKAGGESFNVPLYGAFCTGKYTYLWNSGYYFSNDVDSINAAYKNGLKLKYKIIGSDTKKEISNFRLIRVDDAKRNVCKTASGYVADTVGGNTYKNDGSLASEIDISKYPLENEPETILRSVTGDGSGLAIYDLNSTLPVTNGNSSNLFYSVTFILGTVRGGINVTAQGNYCKTPEDYANSDIENFDYCAINKFNFAAQTTGG